MTEKKREQGRERKEYNRDRYWRKERMRERKTEQEEAEKMNR